MPADRLSAAPSRSGAAARTRAARLRARSMRSRPDSAAPDPAPQRTMHIGGNAGQAQLVRGRAHGAIAQDHAAAMQALPVAGQLEGQLGGLCGEASGVLPADAVTSNVGRLARTCCCHCIRPSASSALSSGSGAWRHAHLQPVDADIVGPAQLCELQRGRSARADAEAAIGQAHVQIGLCGGALELQSGPRRAGAASSSAEPSQASGAPLPCTLIEPRSSRMPATRRSRTSISPSRTTSSRIRPCGSRAAVVLNVRPAVALRSRA